MAFDTAGRLVNLTNVASWSPATGGARKESTAPTVSATRKNCSGHVIKGHDQTGGIVLGGQGCNGQPEKCIHTTDPAACCELCLKNYTGCDAWVRDPVPSSRTYRNCWLIKHPTGTKPAYNRDIGLLVPLPRPVPGPPPPPPLTENATVFIESYANDSFSLLSPSHWFQQAIRRLAWRNLA